MKKVYIPTEEELLEMEELTKNNGRYNGSIMYKYLICKTIEALIREGFLEGKNILELTYKYFRENPEIAIAICKMYPDEIKYSDYAKNDIELCLDLIDGKNPDTTIYSLDNLIRFQEGIGVLSNRNVIKKVVDILIEKLPTTPQYRFEYKDPNVLLDDIFGCNLESIHIDSNMAKKLAIIEPANAIMLGKKLYEQDNQSLESIYTSSIQQYGKRYGIKGTAFPEYFGEDIINNPDTNVKRLLRHLDRHKRKYQ